MPRVLDVKKGELCYIVGTVYIDQPLKPNILEDVARDKSLPAPSRPDKIYSPNDTTFLEDESGRIRIVGEPVKEATLVTGLIISALGKENDSGEFDVVDICYCGLAPQPKPFDSNSDNIAVDGSEYTNQL
jgi:DNA polymerase delta subunit 2